MDKCISNIFTNQICINFFSDTSLATLLSVRRDRSPVPKPEPVTQTRISSNTQESLLSNSNNGAEISSAKLLSHIVSQGSQPFQSAMRNHNPPNPLTLPNLGNTRLISSDLGNDNDDFVLLELLQPTKSSAFSQTLNNKNIVGQVSNQNIRTSRNENFLVSLDGSSTGRNVFQNDDRIVINNLGNQVPNIRNSNNVRNFFPNNNQVSVPLPNQSLQGPSLSSTLNNNQLGVPLPSFANQLSTGTGIGHSQVSSFSNQGSILGGAGFGNNQAGINQPIISNQGIFNSGSRFNQNQLGASSTLFSNQGNTGVNGNNALTVGDLVMSLNGRNGIRVVSLGDLTNAGPQLQSQSNFQSDLLQQLRNAMISGNINNFAQQPQPSSLVDLGVGFPLPSHLQQDIDLTKNIATEDESNFGRQFTFNFDQNNQNAANTDGGVINELLQDANQESISPVDGSFIDAVFNTADIGDNIQDPFPVTFDDEIDPFAAPLEDNTDFSFDSYEDDLPPLPPQPPNVFRRGLSDIFFTKGQWIGTILGGLFDVGSAIGGGVSKIFKKGSDEAE